MKTLILLFYLLPGCSPMLPPHWCRCGWRDETCSRAEVAHLYSFSLHRREKEGEGWERTYDPQSVWTSSRPAFVPMLLWRWREGRTEGGKGRWGQLTTRQSSPNWIKVHIHFCSCAESLLALIWAFQWVKKNEKWGELSSWRQITSRTGAASNKQPSNHVVTAHPENLCCNTKQAHTAFYCSTSAEAILRQSKSASNQPRNCGS